VCSARAGCVLLMLGVFCTCSVCSTHAGCVVLMLGV